MLTANGLPSLVVAGLNLYCCTASKLVCSKEGSSQRTILRFCGIPFTSTVSETKHRALMCFRLASSENRASTALIGTGGLIPFSFHWSPGTGASAAGALCCARPQTVQSAIINAIIQKRRMNLSNKSAKNSITPSPAPASETHNPAQSPSGSHTARSHRRALPAYSSPAAANGRPS